MAENKKQTNQKTSTVTERKIDKMNDNREIKAFIETKRLRLIRKEQTDTWTINRQVSIYKRQRERERKRERESEREREREVDRQTINRQIKAQVQNDKKERE